MQDHVEEGQLYLEYVKSDVQQKNSRNSCEFCELNPVSLSKVERVPRLMPHTEALPDLQYLSCDQTPLNTLNGFPRRVDDFQPRAQIKKKYQDGTLSLDNNESIEMFSIEEHLI